MKQASKIFLPTAIIKIHVSSPGGIPSEHTMPLKVNNFNRMKYQVLSLRRNGLISYWFFITLGKFKRMTFEKTYEISNNELKIKLPKKFSSVKKVRVIVEDAETERSKKIQLLKKASTDPLFNSDIEEIKNDFQYSDKEAI